MPDANSAFSPASDVTALIAATCARIPPLWDLPNYVAVNPFLGWSDRSLTDSARAVADGLGARVLPDVAWYRHRWRENAFGPEELAQAAGRLGHDATVLQAILNGTASVPTRSRTPVLTFAERYDRRFGTNWNDLLLRNLTRWCAVEIAGAGAHWSFDTDGLVRYATWRQSAAVDRSLEIAGLAGWRAWARELPAEPDAAIVSLLHRLQIPAEAQEAYLYRLLGGIFGFASYLRRATWTAGSTDPGPLADLLAIRIASDAGLATLLPGGDADEPASPTAEVEDEAVRLALQEALEDGYARNLIGSLQPPPLPRPRPAVQAVFCIDVRSEPFRRHLEACDAGIQTIGFAGFFGVFLDWHADGISSARCPVLFKPQTVVSSGRSPSPAIVHHLSKHAQSAPAAAFSFVELLGLAYGIGMTADALVKRTARRPAEGTDPINVAKAGDGCGIDGSGIDGPGIDGPGIDNGARTDIAAGILKNMGLRRSFGRLVLLCGHEGRSANNPHQAGLDCGACGGHGGAINARVAAAILNDPVVRTALIDRGWQLPEDSWFVPGVHDTTTDAVTLFDTDRLPTSHAPDLQRLRQWLAVAGTNTRAERATALGLAVQPKPRLLPALIRRAEDVSEVRPEWALARNAAFIAARRGRTQGVNLQGRSFLHEYDCATDPDDTILTLILIAPMVVASWINLQYFASTVDNDVFGCGNKTLHNRLGAQGVVIGNGGDLRTGLPLQSVCNPDGSWYHEPLRLQVIVEAARERIDGVLGAHPGVRDLVENGWVRLFALDPEGDAVWRRLACGRSEPVAVAALRTQAAA